MAMSDSLITKEQGDAINTGTTDTARSNIIGTTTSHVPSTPTFIMVFIILLAPFTYLLKLPWVSTAAGLSSAGFWVLHLLPPLQRTSL